MTAFLSPVFGAGAQLFDNQGRVLAGGKIYTYQASTSTPLATYTDSTGTISNANPVILDSAGRTPNEIWLLQADTYKLILTDSAGGVLGTWDNIAGINDTSAPSISEWYTTALTPSYISGTSFSVSGNQTSIFTVNRRIQAVVSAGTVYGYVTASSFGGSITTVTVKMDSTALDSGLSSVNVGLLNASNVSVPQQYLAANAVTDVASASTTLIGAATSINVRITGTVTITAFDNVLDGIIRIVRFAGALTLTHGASLLLPGGANITTTANDEAIFRSKGSGNWECISYFPAAGLAPKAGDAAQTFDVANATSATNAVNRQFGDARYAALAGSASQTFSVANATTTNQAVALGQFANSAATTGYTNLPNGIVLQWGQITCTVGANPATFPVAFATACLNVQITAQSSQVSATATSYANTYTVSGFNLYNNANSPTTVFAWFAIGH